MKILAFDTTNSGFSVSILENDKILCEHNVHNNNVQSEFLIPSIEDCLKKK